MYTHIIPYASDKKLANAYNEAVRSAPSEWILFTDADVMFLLPEYGHLIESVIQANPDAGLITCCTNRSKTRAHLTEHGIMAETDLLRLRKIALDRYQQYGTLVTERRAPFAGLFLLFRKAAWASVGGFNGGGMLGVDRRFSVRVQRAGFKLLRIEGLFVAHFYRLDTGIHSTDHLKRKVQGDLTL